MDIHDRRESNLQEINPEIETQDNNEEENNIKEENNHKELNQQKEEPLDPVRDEESIQPDPAIGHENIQPIIQPQQEIPRQTSLIGKLEYDNIRVSFPTSTETGINSYMIYKVKYTWQGKDFIVNRRFSDFTSLRNSLRKFMPCHYVFPVHKKKTIVNLLGQSKKGFSH